MPRHPTAQTLPVLLLILAALPGQTPAQSVRSGLLLATSADPALPHVPWLQESTDARTNPSQARAFLSSLILPGLGQYQQGKRRWLLYAGIEVAAAVLYLDRRGDGQDLRRDYRNLAWEVARQGLSEGPRQDGSFGYYETLSRWSRSGAWDTDPGTPALQPETDPATFNGSIWTLASQIFDLDPGDPAGSPGYGNALAYYEERGYGPRFLWDWTGSPGSQDDFGRLIERSDERFRAARQAVGVLIANHLLSALDGLITARLASSFEGRATVRLEVPLGH